MAGEQTEDDTLEALSDGSGLVVWFDHPSGTRSAAQLNVGLLGVRVWTPEPGIPLNWVAEVVAGGQVIERKRGLLDLEEAKGEAVRLLIHAIHQVTLGLKDLIRVTPQALGPTFVLDEDVA